MEEVGDVEEVETITITKMIRAKNGNNLVSGFKSDRKHGENGNSGVLWVNKEKI